MSAHPEPFVRAANLVREFPLGRTVVRALAGVDLVVAAGEFVVLKGASGSGKSTLLSLLAGLDRPTSGTLVVAGRDLARADEAALTAFRRQVSGMVFQTFNLLPTLTVLENAVLPALLAGRPLGPARERARALFSRLGLSGREAHTPDALSGGEMQRAAIVRALINDPPLILADEPTGNLDSVNGAAVVDLIAGLHRDEGRTVLMATHADIADHAATRVVRLADGKVAGEEPGGAA